MEDLEQKKLVSTPLELVTNPIDQLDIILAIINDDEWRPLTFSHIRLYVANQKIQIPEKDLVLAIEKLFNDKYISLATNSQDFPIHKNSYTITYLGRLLLKSTTQKFKNRPYRQLLAKEQRNKIWTIVKITAAVVNSIAILVIGFFGVYLSNKTDSLEAQLEKNNLELAKEKSLKIKAEYKIDSLIKLQHDSTKLKTKHPN